MLADLNCKYGEIPRWSEAQGGWACASGQDSLAQKTCSTVGEVLAWSGTAWECATDQDMLYTLNCQQGEVAIAGDYGDPWSCAKDSDQAIELSCPRGQILKWKSSKWECTPDEDQAAKLCGAGQKFARKTNSGWECKAEDDMQQMHLSLYRPAAPQECTEYGWVQESGYDDGRNSGVKLNQRLETGEIRERTYKCFVTETKMVKDKHTTGDFDPLWITSMGSKIYFNANHGTSGSELWSYDPTAAEAKAFAQVKDIDTDVGDSGNPTHLVAMGDNLYFSADEGTNGIELWKSDGTGGNTNRVTDIRTRGDHNANPTYLATLGNKVYFSAIDTADKGTELWSYDGTNSAIIKNINTGTSQASNPKYLTTLGEKIYFQAEGSAAEESNFGKPTEKKMEPSL